MRRSRVRQGLLVAAVALLVYAGYSVYRESQEGAREAKEAEEHFEEVQGLVAAGQADAGMALLIETVRDHPGTDVVQDDQRLSDLLRTFPAAALAKGGEDARDQLEDWQGERFSALCDEAILLAHGESDEAAAAEDRLLALLGIGKQTAAIQQPGEPAREAALRGLASISDPAFIGQLRAAAADAGADGYDACLLLARMGDAGVAVLAELIYDKSEVVREAATAGLAEAPAELAIPVVTAGIESSDAMTRIRAAQAAELAILGDGIWAEQARALLEPLVGEPAVAIGAVEYTIELGKPESVEALIEGLTLSGDVRAAERLLNCGNETLAQAAEDWADANGYSIQQRPGVSGVQWGGK